MLATSCLNSQKLIGQIINWSLQLSEKYTIVPSLLQSGSQSSFTGNKKCSILHSQFITFSLVEYGVKINSKPLCYSQCLSLFTWKLSLLQMKPAFLIYLYICVSHMVRRYARSLANCTTLQFCGDSQFFQRLFKVHSSPTKMQSPAKSSWNKKCAENTKYYRPY